MAGKAPIARDPWLLLLGPYPPPAGGVASYLQSVFDHVPAGECDWYGFGDRTFDEGLCRSVSLPEYSPSAFLAHRRHPEVVLDCSAQFLEYLDFRQLRQWLATTIRSDFRWIKVVHDTNLPRLFEQYGVLQRWLVRLSSLFVWRYVAVNQELARWLCEELVSPRKVVTIPSLIETPTCEAVLQPPEAFRCLAEQSDLVVCAVGAMNREYGFADVAEVVRRLSEEWGKRIGLVLVCTGFTSEPGYLEQLRSLSPGLVVLENLPRAQMHSVIQGSDVFVRSVRAESYGLSRVEAICLGTPVVATRTGEVRGMHCYEFGDVGGLLEQLKLALSDTSRESLVSQADIFTAEAMANRQCLLGLLEEAAGWR